MSSVPKIFISYTHRDKEWVRQFVLGLRQRGFSPWLDEQELELGTNFSDAIERAFRASNTVIFVIGSDSIQSKWMQFELGAALSTGKRIVPIIPKDIPPSSLPHSLRIRTWIERGAPDETAQAFANAFDSEELDSQLIPADPSCKHA
jgi:hypothetical protein